MGSNWYNDIRLAIHSTVGTQTFGKVFFLTRLAVGFFVRYQRIRNSSRRSGDGCSFDFREAGLEQSYGQLQTTYCNLQLRTTRKLHELSTMS